MLFVKFDSIPLIVAVPFCLNDIVIAANPIDPKAIMQILLFSFVYSLFYLSLLKYLHHYDAGCAVAFNVQLTVIVFGTFSS